MTQNQSIPINTSSPTLSSKQPAGPGNGHPALCSDGVSDGGIWKSWASGRNGGGAGPRDSFTENKPAWGGKRLRGRRRKKKQRKSAGGNIRESKKRERGECLRLQRIKNCAISKRASPAQIKLVSGHEGLAPWHHILASVAWPNPHHHISRPQRSREMPACIFWGKTLEQFCALMFVSHHLLLQWFHHAAAPTFYNVRFKCAHVWHDEGAGGSRAAPFIHRARRRKLRSCLFSLRTYEKKKPPPSLTLRGLAGKDRHFLDFMHHVNTAYGLSILRLLYCNSRLHCQCVTRCEMQWNGVC